MGGSQSSHYNGPTREVGFTRRETFVVSKPAIVTYGQAECSTANGASYVAMVKYLSLPGSTMSVEPGYTHLRNSFVESIYTTRDTASLFTPIGSFGRCTVKIGGDSPATIFPGQLLTSTVKAHLDREGCLRAMLPDGPMFSPSSLPNITTQLPNELWRWRS